MNVSKDDLVRAIRRLGLSGRPVCVHSSLRSFGHVEGGADAIVDAFHHEAATLLVPSFSWAFSVPAPPDDRPRRNGTQYDYRSPSTATESFTPKTHAVDPDMGALPGSVVAHTDRKRGDHPLCSFAAVGPLASALVGAQRPDSVWAPLDELVREDGTVILMGVGLNRLTLIHLAETVAGRRPFVRWALDRDGKIIRTDVGGCSDGFGGLSAALAEVEVVQVGKSLWSVMSARTTLRAVSEMIQDSPEVTRCDDADCDRCRDSIAGGPIEP